ncbi:hypothetical protein [Streptomyces sp. NBC_00878]|uniref:hypothetical protein n=1 Tax=Streptomyces sp. NBC_00878 TaxID=2975854 RepID=UPI00225A6211|nr:hypothetical protein [Streptomyces sp. NBC_00878]MCX4904515.1 hypothetical protein [Streptomyces sp. NBC_00878]
MNVLEDIIHGVLEDLEARRAHVSIDALQDRAAAMAPALDARDLRTLTVDRAAFTRLAGRIPDGVVRVAESGIRSASDVADCAAAGADAVLVGTLLVTADQPASAVRELTSPRPGGRSFTHRPRA